MVEALRTGDGQIGEERGAFRFPEQRRETTRACGISKVERSQCPNLQHRTAPPPITGSVIEP